jgi:hypothetical protein
LQNGEANIDFILIYLAIMTAKANKCMHPSCPAATLWCSRVMLVLCHKRNRDMRDIAQQLKEFIGVIEPQLSKINEDDLGLKPSLNEWSKKEILGHLIHSAANNHQRFVRAVYQVADQFPTYDQNKWVTIQHYNDIPWSALIAFWTAYNNHLIHVIEYIPSEAGSSLCNIGKEEPVRLDFVIQDYLRHLHHHIDDILNK